MKWVAAITTVILGLFSNHKPQAPSPIEAQITRTSPFSPSPDPGEGNQKEGVLLSVPFTSQAPFGEWGDPRHQDGCEEAASLMAVLAMRQVTMTKPQFSREIEKIWEWEVKNYGSGVDTSAEDTAERIIGGYFNNFKYQISNIKYYGEIVDELAKGNVVIVPVDGRGLNPNYTAPGPERHMILIRGYDDETGEFITNDAGTRRGEKYRYKYEVLFKAVRDYPTGDHVPITSVDKRMIVIQ
ncbi:C39 family peptidase [Candidatus Amesbacteria bacterium]|nr:C39 family peptidase [Candidatus Amesbacteria bacterium]MBI2587664.1 C39 family peptidase [Candidatus Amesbacteria bacterium]